jgi:hypothetical protein
MQPCTVGGVSTADSSESRKTRSLTLSALYRAREAADNAALCEDEERERRDHR